MVGFKLQVVTCSDHCNIVCYGTRNVPTKDYLYIGEKEVSGSTGRIFEEIICLQAIRSLFTPQDEL